MNNVKRCVLCDEPLSLCGCGEEAQPLEAILDRNLDDIYGYDVKAIAREAYRLGQRESGRQQ